LSFQQRGMVLRTPNLAFRDIAQITSFTLGRFILYIFVWECLIKNPSPRRPNPSLLLCEFSARSASLRSTWTLIGQINITKPLDNHITLIYHTYHGQGYTASSRPASLVAQDVIFRLQRLWRSVRPSAPHCGWRHFEALRTTTGTHSPEIHRT